MKENYCNSVKNIQQICDGKLLTGEQNIKIEKISTDSRDLDQKTLFIPLVGEKFNGHDYLLSLLQEKKIAGALTAENLAYAGEIPVIACSDTLQALGKIAEQYRLQQTARVIGITGTNGKTTTKEITSAIFAGKYHTLKNEKNYNNEIGVPFTLLRLKKQHEYAVIEMGMNHLGEISRLSAQVKPDIALITNIGEGHLEFLETLDNVALAKSEIMESMQPESVILLNKDSYGYQFLAAKAEKLKLKVKNFSLKDSTADYFPEKYKLFADHIEITLQKEMYVLSLAGLHNAYNFLAALSLALEEKMPSADIKQGLTQFHNVDGRSQLFEGKYTVINDTYNSNPLSLKAALQSVNSIYLEKRKIAVLADMKELGAASESFHLEAGKNVVKNNFSALFTFGELASFMAKGASQNGLTEIYSFTDKDKMIKELKKYLKDNDVILIKGSRSMKMEEIAEALFC